MTHKIAAPQIPPILSYSLDNLAEVAYADALNRGPRLPDNQFWERFTFERQWRLELLDRVAGCGRGDPCRKS